MNSRTIKLRRGYLHIESELPSDSSNNCDCTKDMLFADQVPIQCTEENLSIIEPIIITVRSRLYTGGGANYFVHIVARYEPDVGDILHVLIPRNFIEKEEDRAYFHDTPLLRQCHITDVKAILTETRS